MPPLATCTCSQLKLAKTVTVASKYSVGAGLDGMLEGLPDFSALPTAIVHGELGQALQDASGRLVLVDWDEAGIGTALVDAAGRLICDFIDYDCRIAEASAVAFYRSYFAGRRPSAAELDHLVPLAALYALAYSNFADTEARFARVLFALRQRDTLEDLVRDCAGALGHGES